MSQKKTTTSVARGLGDLPIQLNPSIRNQSARVHAALRSAIVDGLLTPDQTLPSSRALAEQIGINRNAVVSAYEQLQSDGLIEARRGSGTFVAQRLPVPASQIAITPSVSPSVPLPRRAFALGFTEINTALMRDLSRATSRAMMKATNEQLGYGDPRGSINLRREIASFLASSRGIHCDPSCILVANGTQSGLRLCMEALLKPGDKIGIEDPGYYVAKNTLKAIGLRILPVPVDQEGVVISTKRKGPQVSAIYVTPSHQFPTGVTMSMPRRVALLQWAQDTGAWIFEDDYDSEFRYAGPPLTALAGLGSERVIYCGTFAKTLFPSLRLAYLVLPPSIIDRIVEKRASYDRFPPNFMQEAVAELMAKGQLARHLRRVRGYYREARDTVARALSSSAGKVLDVITPTQGLHMVTYLPAGYGPQEGAEIRNIANVNMKLISEMRIHSKGREGFILGFSGHPLNELHGAATRLGQAAADYNKNRS